MRAAYYGGTELTGAGQSVALVQFGGYLIEDVVANFNGAATATANGSNFNLNYTPSLAGPTYTIAINSILLDGQTMPVYSDQSTWTDDTEEALDIAQAIGMAPGLSNVNVYVGQSDVDILARIASDDSANQVSISWTWSPDDPETDDFLFEEMAAQGQSVFAATGDYGSYSVLFDSYFPGEDAYITAVGGTDLATNGAGGQWASETTWGNSGGGVSPDAIPIPSWQQGIANSVNQASTVYRNAPDVAMEGNFDNYTCSLGVCQGGWGERALPLPAGQGTWRWSTRPRRRRDKIPSAFSIRWSTPLARGRTILCRSMTSRPDRTDTMPVMAFLISTPCLDTTWSPAGAARQAKDSFRFSRRRPRAVFS